VYFYYLTLLKHLPYDVAEDDELRANEGQNCLRPTALLSNTLPVENLSGSTF
jgi:hypothetical protein